MGKFAEGMLILLLGCVYLGPALGQAFPELQKALDAKEKVSYGLRELEQILDGNNVNLDRIIGLITENEDTRTILEQKLSDAVSGSSEAAIVQISPTGERYYSFNRLARSDESRDGEDDRVLVSEQCVTDVLQYYTDLRNGVFYAERMNAARGRPDINTAIYAGEWKDTGNFWICTSTKANKTSGIPSFNGKYCYADWTLSFGACWPDTCTDADVNAAGKFFWADIVGVSPPNYDCTEKQPWNTADIGFMTTLAFFAFLVLCGSVYDVFLQELVLEKMRAKTCPDNDDVKAMDNVYENPAATDDQGSEIATSSADGSVVEEAIEEKKNHIGLVPETELMGTPKGTPPPSYQAIDLSYDVHVDTDKESRKSEKKRKNANIGWAILHATLMSFSAVTNCRKLLSAKKTKNTMAVLNGLRVISMWWVILGHSVQFNVGRYGNTYQAVNILDSMGFYAITNATPSVDTFFVLSGFLVTYLSLKQIDSGKLKSAGSWVMFYFHRWWRLTPVYMAAMGIWALLLPHFGQGIYADEIYDFVKGYCRKQWWTHPLYINNLVPWPNVLDQSCMGWAWYLANDMQFYVISPIILVLLYKNQKAGITLITSIMLVSLGSLFGISWYYGYTINTQEPYTDNVPDPPNADTTYAKPYTRIPTYLVGMILGYIMFKLRGKKLKLPLTIIILGWVVALATLWAVIYGVWFSSDKTDVPQGVAVTYLTFHRLAWGVGICWIIFACLQGYGGPIGVLLDWSFWIPLARLTYCAYLIHPVIITSNMLTSQVYFHVTYVSLSYLFVGNVVFSYASALVLSLLVEGPTMGLEKVMFGKFKRS